MAKILKFTVAKSDNVRCDLLIKILGGHNEIHINWEKMIKGNLPEGTIVAQKTDSSGTNEAGFTAARNNIGIVFLPNGRYFYLSVLISESKNENKKIIADIAKLTWDYFNNN